MPHDARAVEGRPPPVGYNRRVCTMTWHVTPGGYRIFFNRDERRERKPELPPVVRSHQGTRSVAPVDGDFGGTWIAANEHGLTVCLLNGFAAADAPPPDPSPVYTTRGVLPLAAVEHRDSRQIAGWLRELRPHAYRPFMMAVFEPGGPGLFARWSGATIEVVDGPPPERPLVSSSFCTEQVRRNRATVYDELVTRADAMDPLDAHLAFHGSHRPRAGPHSPCMHRPDAATMSFSRVDVDEHAVRFHYSPTAPCRGLPREPVVTLERHAAAAGQ